jgi:uncharacterized protein (TIGR03435 family)
MAAFACVALGQEFEVVSVKPNKSLDNSSHTHSDQGRLTTENVSLRNLIVMAYGMKDFQVEGPDWLSSERFDIAAKFPEALSKDKEKYSAELHAMMQQMLLDRFRLAVHRDRKTFAVYGLMVGKSGIKFKEVPDGGSHNSNSNNNHYTGTCVSMATFADFLSRRVDLPVLDMTGLTGFYDLTLDWVPEPRQSGESKGAAPLVADSPSGPTLLDAVQGLLGLKLETRKAPIEILIVDHAERVPTEN